MREKLHNFPKKKKDTSIIFFYVLSTPHVNNFYPLILNFNCILFFIKFDKEHDREQIYRYIKFIKIQLICIKKQQKSN